MRLVSIGPQLLYKISHIAAIQLKLYTMNPQFEVRAPIDDSYSAYSHSVDTLSNWYKEKTEVGNLAVISQVLFPIFVTFYIFI